MMANFGLERGTYGSEVKHRSNTAYNKEFKRSKQKKTAQRVSRQTGEEGKLRIKETYYSIFGNSELNEAEECIAMLGENWRDNAQ